MIAIDTSALVAIATEEPESAAFNDVMARRRIVVGTPTLLEASMVLPSLVTQVTAEQFLADFLADSWVEAIPFSVEMFEAARAAFHRFGRGRHPAKLNLGDCMTYGLAKIMDVPLLYKGSDFALTDLRSALPVRDGP